MSDRLFRRCFVAAVGVHLGVLAAGGWLAPRIAAPEEDPLRTIAVGLEPPDRPVVAVRARTPVAVAVPSTLSRPAQPPLPASASAMAAPAPRPASRVAGRPSAPSPSANPGGALNLGAPSEQGDLPGLPSGQTPVGWVPGPDFGKGAGSGTGEGVGRPEPVPAVPPAAVPAPETKPEPPPPPRRVSVRVCASSRLRPNPYCPECVVMEFTEGTEPREVCAQHQPPPPPAPTPPAPQPTPPREEKPAEPRFTPARLVHSVKPEYPASALEGDHQGVVVVQVEVRADGSCGDVQVVQSSGSRVLDRAAVRAVKQWRWEPARRGDQPVASTARCRIRFELEEE